MQLKSFILPLCGAIVACALVRHYWPRIEIKTVIQTVIKNRTLTRIVKQPNGTTITEIDSTTASTTSSTTLANKLPQWHVSAGILTDFGFKDPLRYQVAVERRILGPFYAGALLSTEPMIGLIIGLDF